jgi:hypothetical protein
MSGEAAEPAREQSVVRGAGLAFVVALAATLVMAAPVVLAPSERIFGSSQTFGRQDPNRDPFIVMEQFRTGHVPGPYLQPLTDLPGRALAGLLGPVAAYNVLVLATFPLSAAAACLLAPPCPWSHLAAMVAGLAYAFLPFHVAHATGHPHVAQTQWPRSTSWPCGSASTRPICERILLLAAGAAVPELLRGLIAQS